MSGFTIIECETANELWEKLSPVGQRLGLYNPIIYRGQANAEWGLVPSVLREDSIVRKFIRKEILHTDIQIVAEMELLQQFTWQVDALGLSIPGDTYRTRTKLQTGKRGTEFLRNPLSWPSPDLVGLMALAQQHKIPTRLLDWSRRPYVAAYFAASSALARSDEGKRAAELAVWKLDAETIRHVDSDDERLATGSLHPNIRLVTAPGAVSANLAAQQGLFTLSIERGAIDKPLQTVALEDEFLKIVPTPLTKYTLPFEQADELLALCQAFGVNAASMFPSYDGASAAALEVARRWKAMNS